MDYRLDIEVYNEYGEHVWAQERYLVHGWDDVLWTSDLFEAINYLQQELQQLELL